MLIIGLPSKDEEETLARLVNRYAAQGHKQNIFLTARSSTTANDGMPKRVNLTEKVFVYRLQASFSAALSVDSD